MSKTQHVYMKKRLKSFEAKARSSKARRNRLKKSRILIIQERNMISELLSQLLSEKGCWVDTAVSALEGFIKIKRKKFDLIIVDTETPNWDKYDFIKKTKEINEKIFLVILDGIDNNGGSDRFNDPNITLVIPKPLDIKKVMKKITRLLNAGI